MKIKILNTQGYGLLAEIIVKEQILGVMDDFSKIPNENIDLTSPEFSYLTMDGYSWSEMFSGNLKKIKELKRTGSWSYEAFGQIISINPVVADFGVIKLEIGEITNDKRCIGEWILEKIDRLDLTFKSKYHE